MRSKYRQDETAEIYWTRRLQRCSPNRLILRCSEYHTVLNLNTKNHTLDCFLIEAYLHFAITRWLICKASYFVCLLTLTLAVLLYGKPVFSTERD